MRCREGDRGRRRVAAGIGRGLVALALILAAATAGWPAQAPEADVFVARAILAYDEQRYEEALAELRRALQLAPDHVDALYYTGLTLFALGRTNEAIASFEQALQRQPDDDAILFQLGLAHLSRGDYDQAQPFLERAFAINPKRDSLGYYVGLLRYHRRDYPGAVQAFRQGEASSPEIQQLARLYSGLALAGLGQPEGITRELEEALRIQPASPLTGPAERLRQAVVAARERERRFHAELRLGGFYDDNVPVVPGASTQDFIKALRAGKRASWGELAAARLDYSLYRRPGFDTTLTYSFFTNYNNDLPAFNLVGNLVGITGTYSGTLAGLPFYLSLPYTYDFFFQGGDPYVQRHIVGPWASLAEGHYNLTTVQARYTYKDFYEKPIVLPEDNRDANNWMLGFSHLFRFQRDRHLLRFGYQFDVENAKGSNLSYNGHRVVAGAQYTLPWGGVRLNYDFDVHLRSYRHNHTTLPPDAPNTTRRSDTEYTHVVSLTVPLPWSLAFVLQYQRTWDESNLDLFSYTRNVVFSFLVWTY
jgi:tetratricopeptide (TPR) repeat protein